MTLTRTSIGPLLGAAVVILLVLLPLALSSGDLSLPTEIFIFALFAITYDLLFGFTGLISFGHALFIGFGGYALAISMTNHGVSFGPAMAIVLIAGIAVSLLTGVLALRTRGVYFAMVTLAFAQAAYTLAESNVGNLSNGENGLGVNGAPQWLTGPTSQAHFYYVALAALIVGYLLMRLFVESPAGRVWQAVRENEQRALMIGYHPFAFKLLAYTISGTIATLTGALYALFVGTVTTNLFTADYTIQLLLMVIIGGAGSLWGAAIGAALVRYLDHYLNTLATSSFVTSLPSWLHQSLGQPLLIFGIIYLVLIYVFPQGIAGLVRTRLQLPASVPRPGLGEVEGRAVATAAGDAVPLAEGTGPIETPRGS